MKRCTRHAGRFGIRIEESLLEAARRKAQKEDRPLAQVIRALIRAWVRA